MKQVVFRKEVKKLGKVIFDEVTKRANKVPVYKKYFSDIYFTLPNGFKVNYHFSNGMVKVDREEHIPGYYGDDRYHEEYLHSEYVHAYQNPDLGFYVSAGITHYEDGYEMMKSSPVVTCDKGVYSRTQRDLSIEEQEKILEILRSIIEELPKLEIDKSRTREEYELKELAIRLKQASKQMHFRRALKSAQASDPSTEVLPSVKMAVDWWLGFINYSNSLDDFSKSESNKTFEKLLGSKIMEELSAGDPVVISVGPNIEIDKKIYGALKKSGKSNVSFLRPLRMNISVDEVKITYLNTMNNFETEVLFTSSKEPALKF